jgi:Glu-tRNA(Gln) amidotransferase subunit E-like FAD-binding protein
VLLGGDWIRANACVPSTLHQCVIQCVGNEVEVITADDTACIAMAEAPVDVQDGRMSYLMGCHTRFLRPKPDAHRMYAQDQVVIHTVRM